MILFINGVKFGFTIGKYLDADDILSQIKAYKDKGILNYGENSYNRKVAFRITSEGLAISCNDKSNGLLNYTTSNEYYKLLNLTTQSDIFNERKELLNRVSEELVEFIIGNLNLPIKTALHDYGMYLEYADSLGMQIFDIFSNFVNVSNHNIFTKPLGYYLRVDHNDGDYYESAYGYTEGFRINMKLKFSNLSSELKEINFICYYGYGPIIKNSSVEYDKVELNFEAYNRESISVKSETRLEDHISILPTDISNETKFPMNLTNVLLDEDNDVLYKVLSNLGLDQDDYSNLHIRALPNGDILISGDIYVHNFIFDSLFLSYKYINNKLIIEPNMIMIAEQWEEHSKIMIDTLYNKLLDSTKVESDEQYIDRPLPVDNNELIRYKTDLQKRIVDAPERLVNWLKQMSVYDSNTCMLALPLNETQNINKIKLSKFQLDIAGKWLSGIDVPSNDLAKANMYEFDPKSINIGGYLVIVDHEDVKTILNRPIIARDTLRQSIVHTPLNDRYKYKYNHIVDEINNPTRTISFNSYVPRLMQIDECYDPFHTTKINLKEEDFQINDKNVLCKEIEYHHDDYKGDYSESAVAGYFITGNTQIIIPRPFINDLGKWVDLAYWDVQRSVIEKTMSSSKRPDFSLSIVGQPDGEGKDYERFQALVKHYLFEGGAGTKLIGLEDKGTFQDLSNTSSNCFKYTLMADSSNFEYKVQFLSRIETNDLTSVFNLRLIGPSGVTNFHHWLLENDQAFKTSSGIVPIGKVTWDYILKCFKRTEEEVNDLLVEYFNLAVKPSNYVIDNISSIEAKHIIKTGMAHLPFQMLNMITDSPDIVKQKTISSLHSTNILTMLNL